MRLTRDEISAIRRCAAAAFGADCEITLFGSRVDDTRRGGDIDLHVVADRADLTDELAFREALAASLGERRVDLVLRRRGFVPRAIDKVALSTGSRL